nr:copia protein [Tanacetum cinerariifolium]
MRLIQSLAFKELVRNLPKLKFDQHFCDACKMGKQAHPSHKAKNIVSMTRCLELLHMDLFGPSALRSYRGNHYTLVIVDDYSRYTWTRFLKDKTEAFNQFEIFSKKIQNQLGCTIVSIRTDHGREFDNEVKFEEFYNANGKTPYELLKGRKPTLDYFRVFGSKCFILNTKDYLTKFDPKSYEGVFLGYSQNSEAYIIFNKHTKKIEESLNVTFDEIPPPSKTSPLVDDDLDEEAIRETEKKNLENVVEDETLDIDEIVNINESRNHPLENVIGNLNQRTLSSQAQNQSNLFCFISTIEPKNELVPQPRNMTIIELSGTCDEFAKIMHDKFKISMMGELNFFLGLQIKQMEEGIFFNQSKYIKEMLKKFRLEDSKPMKTLMSSDTKLTKDEQYESVDSTKYRGMIGTKGIGIETVVYVDSDHAGDYVDHKSTSGICTFMRCCMTSWFSKKKTGLAISTIEAEYVSAVNACQQARWMKQALIDYNVRLNDVPIMYDNKGAIDLSINPVQYSHTQHIEICHHFLRDNVQKGHILIEKVPSVDNIADILTKPLKYFAQIINIPCEGACVFTDRWSLNELAYGFPSDGPYQTNPPFPDDIILTIRIDQEGQVCRIRHEEEIDVQDHDHGTRRGQHSTSSSTYNQPSSSNLNDDNDDDDGNNEGTKRASTPSPIRYVNSLTNEVSQVFQNPPNIDPQLEPFYTRQTKIINRQVQFRDEHRGGLRSIEKEKLFVEYTGIKVKQFRETLILHMGIVKKFVAERTRHKRHYDRRMNERQMQSRKSKVVSSKALDASLVVTECSGAKSDEHITRSSSGTYITHVVDADIRLVNDQEPSAEVHLTVQHNVLANEQQDTDQSKPSYNTYLLKKVDSNTTSDSTNMCHRGGEIDQDAEEDQVKSPLLKAEFLKTNDMVEKEVYNELSNKFLQHEKHCISLEISMKQKKESFQSNKPYVNHRIKVQSPKTRNNIKPVEKITNVIKPKRRISRGYKVSPNKSFAVHEKPNTPRSCLSWKLTGRIFKIVGFRWIPTGKMFIDCTTKVDSEPLNSSNEDITNPYECEQTLNVSAGLALHRQMASADNASGPAPQRKERCMLHCALPLKEEKSSFLRAVLSTTFISSHARSVNKWINVQ